MEKIIIEGNLKKCSRGRTIKSLYGASKSWKIRRVVISEVQGKYLLRYFDEHLLKGELNITGFSAERDEFSFEPTCLVKDTTGAEQLRFRCVL